MRTTFFAAILFHLSSILAFGDGLNATDQAALADTQNLLNNQARLSEFTKGNPNAASALDQIKKLTNNDPKKQAEIKQLSSDIFANMTKASNGNDAAMMTKLQEGLRNPASFMQSLSPEQQAKIKAMAAEIDGKK
ncbi:MAG: hypothetical protein ACXWQO_04690 [Bdellovibrionota bacterium]